MKNKLLRLTVAEPGGSPDALGPATGVKSLSVPKHRTATIPGKQFQVDHMKIRVLMFPDAHRVRKLCERFLIATFSSYNRPSLTEGFSLLPEN